MTVKLGDYFDMYKEGVNTTRVIVKDASLDTGDCIVEDILTGDRYIVSPKEEIEVIIGNIFEE